MSKYAQLDSTHTSQLGEILGSLMSGTAADPLVLCRDYEMFMDEMALANGEPNQREGNGCNAPRGGELLLPLHRTNCTFFLRG
jgi:hypothetical protein